MQRLLRWCAVVCRQTCSLCSLQLLAHHIKIRIFGGLQLHVATAAIHRYQQQLPRHNSCNVALGCCSYVRQQHRGVAIRHPSITFVPNCTLQGTRFTPTHTNTHRVRRGSHDVLYQHLPHPTSIAGVMHSAGDVHSTTATRLRPCHQPMLEWFSVWTAWSARLAATNVCIPASSAG